MTAADPTAAATTENSNNDESLRIPTSSVTAGQERELLRKERVPHYAPMR